MRPAVLEGPIPGKVLFVLRDPVHRFASAYFEKISNPRSPLYRNGVSMLEWAEALQDPTYRDSDWHWEAQTNLTKRFITPELVTHADLYVVQEFLDVLMDGTGKESPRLLNTKVKERRYEGHIMDHVTPEIVAFINAAYTKDCDTYARIVGLTP
jgi:hypothetical protein